MAMLWWPGLLFRVWMPRITFFTVPVFSGPFLTEKGIGRFIMLSFATSIGIVISDFLVGARLFGFIILSFVRTRPEVEILKDSKRVPERILLIREISRYCLHFTHFRNDRNSNSTNRNQPACWIVLITTSSRRFSLVTPLFYNLNLLHCWH